VGVLLANGCAPHQRVVIEQPFAPPSQRYLELAPRLAAYRDDGRRCCILLELPLPSMPRLVAYRLYFDVPSGSGPAAIEPDDGEGAVGMFIQEVGALRGKSVFSQGQLDVQTTAKPEVKRLVLDVGDQTGMRVRGTLLLRDDAKAVGAFTARHARDIERLRPGGPRETQAETAPRQVPKPRP